MIYSTSSDQYTISLECADAALSPSNQKDSKSDKVLKVALPSAVAYTLKLQSNKVACGYFKYQIKMGEKEVDTQDLFFPFGSKQAVFKGTFYAATTEEVETGKLPQGVDALDNPRGTNLITVTIREYQDADMDDEPVYRSIASTRSYGSTIDAQAHHFHSVPTARKVPTGNTIFFCVQLKHTFLSHEDQKMRNRLHCLRKEEEERIASCKLRRDAQDLEDDSIVEAALSRKRARQQQFISDVEVIKREAMLKFESVSKMQQEAEIDAALD